MGSSEPTFCVNDCSFILDWFFSTSDCLFTPEPFSRSVFFCSLASSIVTLLREELRLTRKTTAHNNVVIKTMRSTPPPTVPAIIGIMSVFSVGFCSPPSLGGLLEENTGSDDVISTTGGTVPVIVPVAPVAPVAPGAETRWYSSQQSIVGSLTVQSLF